MNSQEAVDFESTPDIDPETDRTSPGDAESTSKSREAGPTRTDTSPGGETGESELGPVVGATGFISDDNPLKPVVDRWRIVAIAGAAGALVALVGSLLTPAVYVAVADYTVSPAASVSDPNDVLNAINTLDSRNRAFLETAADVFQSEPVIQDGITEAGLEPEVIEQVEVEAGVLPSAIIVRLSVSGPDAEAVTNLAVKIGNAATLKVEALYPLYAFELLEPPPLPDGPASPVPLRDATLGLVLGLALGVGVVFAIDRRR